VPKPETVQGRIDGKKIEAPKETTLLKAASAMGISIPSLCCHEGLPPDGNCRVCICEINGKLAVSCMYPLRENGFEARTESEKVAEARRFVLSLLINRAPKAPRIIALAKRYGAKENPRFSANADNCIRCGRCARACKTNLTEAISLSGRGPERMVSGPFGKPPADCVGCLSCALACPTGNIPFSEKGGARFVWEREFPMAACPECGKTAFTFAQLEFYGQDPKAACPECRKRSMAKSIICAASFAPEEKRLP
jgi:NADH dehydrogenase/NADH:ubiquinone oxidoreductase subunit G